MKKIWHHWEKWECYKHGFYNSSPPSGISSDQAKEMYRKFLSDLNKFENALKKVIKEWKYSCEHFLTNSSINKIAWLGQAIVIIINLNCFWYVYCQEIPQMYVIIGSIKIH